LTDIAVAAVVHSVPSIRAPITSGATLSGEPSGSVICVACDETAHAMLGVVL